MLRKPRFGTRNILTWCENDSHTCVESNKYRNGRVEHGSLNLQHLIQHFPSSSVRGGADDIIIIIIISYVDIYGRKDTWLPELGFSGVNVHLLRKLPSEEENVMSYRQWSNRPTAGQNMMSPWTLWPWLVSPSIHPSIHSISIYSSPIHPFLHSSIHPTVHPPTHPLLFINLFNIHPLSIYLSSIHPSNCLAIHLSINTNIYQSAHPSFYPSIQHQSIHPLIYPSIGSSSIHPSVLHWAVHHPSISDSIFYSWPVEFVSSLYLKNWQRLESSL